MEYLIILKFVLGYLLLSIAVYALFRQFTNEFKEIMINSLASIKELSIRKSIDPKSFTDEHDALLKEELQDYKKALRESMELKEMNEKGQYISVALFLIFWWILGLIIIFALITQLLTDTK